MTRVKRGYIARRRRKKFKIRALVSAHRDRDRQKRDFRRLWITRINAVIREKGVYYNYSKFIHDLYKRQLLLNRKILAQIAILNRNCIYMIYNEIIKTKIRKNTSK
ncbi:50S ribosomal protein L20 chloroplastic [Bienertia sinuspersici]